MTGYTLSAPELSGRQRGFSIIEIAVVMVILGLLLGGILMPLASQKDLERRHETQALFEEINNALLGFAAVNGRLPCPSSQASNGREDEVGGICQTPRGFVPGRDLGLTGNFDDDNRLLDRWNRPINYTLTGVNGWEYANAIIMPGTDPDIQVCPAIGCANPLATEVVAVIWSAASDTQGSALQNENSDNDNDYIKAPFSEAAATAFDDEIVWLSRNTLVFHMVKAGRLTGN